MMRVLLLLLALVAGVLSQQIPILLSISGSPPSPPSFTFGLVGRSVGVASATWAYATYDDAPSRFHAVAALNFFVGNVNSYIMRSVWSDVASGRIDYDGHAATTLYLPCNRTYRLLIYDRPDAGAPLLVNSTLALTSCNASLLPLDLNVPHSYSGDCHRVSTWSNIPLYMGAVTTPHIPSAALPFARANVTVTAFGDYGRPTEGDRTLLVNAFFQVNRTVTALQQSQQNATLIVPSSVVVSDLFPHQTVPIVTSGSSTMNANGQRYVDSNSAYTYTREIDVIFGTFWRTHQTCDSRISFSVRLSHFNNNTQSTVVSTHLVFIRTAMPCLENPSTLPRFQVHARRVSAPPPFLIHDGLNRTWSASLDVEGGRSTIASNDTNHLVLFPQLILTNVSFPLTSAFPSASSFQSAPWFIQRAIVSYSNGDVVTIAPVSFVEIRGTRGPITFAFNLTSTPVLRCDQVTQILLESNSTTPSVVGPFVFNATCTPPIPRKSLCARIVERNIKRIEGLVTLSVAFIMINAALCIARPWIRKYRRE